MIDSNPLSVFSLYFFIPSLFSNSRSLYSLRPCPCSSRAGPCLLSYNLLCVDGGNVLTRPECHGDSECFSSVSSPIRPWPIPNAMKAVEQSLYSSRLPPRLYLLSYLLLPSTYNLPHSSSPPLFSPSILLSSFLFL